MCSSLTRTEHLHRAHAILDLQGAFERSFHLSQTHVYSGFACAWRLRSCTPAFTNVGMGT